VPGEFWSSQPEQMRQALGAALSDPVLMARLRSLLAQEGTTLDVSRLGSNELLAAASTLLEPETLRTISAEPIRQTVGGPVAAPEAATAAPEEAAEIPLVPIPPPAKIDLVLLDEDDKGIGSEPYRLVLSDGTVKEGSLDGGGRLLLTDIAAGQCRITFPRLDAEIWKKA